MLDWEDLLKRAKEDVLCALDVWGPVLEETFDSRLEYAYAKGSAVKQWDSPIDYVPVISDLDMHIMLRDSEEMLPGTAQGFSISIEVSKKFEERFYKLRKDYMHIPRAQIIHINPNLNDSTFILPQVSDVKIMVGTPKDGRIPSVEEVRAHDLEQLQGLAEYLEDIPRQAIDRVGLDFWALLRRMCWRISPSPARLLTQVHSNPLEVWTWNRTKILNQLREHEFDSIADSYQKYYETGWKLFLSGFSEYSAFRDTVVHGYAVLQGCLTEVQTHDSCE